MMHHTSYEVRMLSSRSVAQIRCALAIREEKGEHELLWSPVLRAEGQNVVMFHTHHELRLSESMLFAACVSNIEPGKPERDDLDKLQVVCLKARRPKCSDVSYA